MKTIHKYALSFPRRDNSKLQFTMILPKDAHILHVAMQRDCEYPMMWVIVDTDSETEYRELVAIGTGVELPKDKFYTYLGTVQMSIADNLTGGKQEFLVWHYFEVTEGF